MLELNASLLTLQTESDKFLAKIQMNKVKGSNAVITKLKYIILPCRDYNLTQKKEEKRKGEVIIIFYQNITIILMLVLNLTLI